MHYAFDAWMAREFPGCPFERYADGSVVHCVSKRQAEYVLARIAARMQEVGLTLHPDKTRIVYCKDGKRRTRHEHTSFTFLGYTFRHGRRAPSTAGRVRFYRSALHPLLWRVNTYLRRWAGKKYRRLRTYKRFKRWWAGLQQREPGLFAQMAMGPRRLTAGEKSPVTGDCHAGICRSRGLRCPRPPNQEVILCR